MSKRVDTSGLNTELIIGQTDRSNREAKPDPTPPVVPEETAQQEPEPEPTREVKEPSKRKRGQSVGYKETFLKRNEMKTRQCVYISYDVHAVIAKLVRALVSAGNDISVGGYIDTVLAEHLQANKEEINEVSLFSYIYNVLEHHFATFQEDITELYDSNLERDVF